MSNKKTRLRANKKTAQCATESGLNDTCIALDIIRRPDGSSSTTAYPTSPEEMLVNSDAVYLAKTVDRDWFRSHPQRSHKLRRAIPGEIPGGSAETWVVIRHLQPRVRKRCSFDALVAFPSDEAPEQIAHANCDLIAEAPGRPFLLHELLQRSRTSEVAPDPEDASHVKPLRRIELGNPDGSDDMGNGAEVGGGRPRCLDAALEYAGLAFSVILVGGIDARWLRPTRESGSPFYRTRRIRT